MSRRLNLDKVPPHILDRYRRYPMGAATNAVNLAVRRGDLPALRGGKVPCADCGAPARDYDHRDYAKPLDVEPVCRGCNIRRGPGKNREKLNLERLERSIDRLQRQIPWKVDPDVWIED